MEQIPEGFEQVNCPNCGGPQWQVAHTGHDWALDPQRTLCIVRCDKCGLHFTNPRPTPQRLGAYYHQDYAPYQRQCGDIQRRSPLSTIVRTWVLADAYGAPAKKPLGWRRAIVRIARLFQSPEHFGFAIPFHGEGRLLDFGCGDGTFLRRMAAIGWSPTGLDMSPHAVAATAASGIPALQGTLPHPQLSPGSFDVITMRHALEHVPDPRGVLDAAFQLLRPGGQLVVQVPNFASWEFAHFGDAAISLDLPRHLLHFTPETLANLLRSSGFEIVRITQRCRASLLRKSLARSQKVGHCGRWDFLLRCKPILEMVARRAQRRGQGNEIIAIATK